MSSQFNFKEFKIVDQKTLQTLEMQHRSSAPATEAFPWSIGTSYTEICETVITDRNGSWASPLYLVHSIHSTAIGMENLCRKAIEFFQDAGPDYEPLSISAFIADEKIHLVSLVRSYSGNDVNFTGFFPYIGEDVVVAEPKRQEKAVAGTLVVPEELKDFRFSPEQIAEHQRQVEQQKQLLKRATKETPFLNMIDTYEPTKMFNPLDEAEVMYCVVPSSERDELIGSREEFNKVFQEVMQYVNGVEYYAYIAVVGGDGTEEDFLRQVQTYVESEYVNNKRLQREDLPALMRRLKRSLFQLYVLQDLIDDPNVTDINVTAYNCVRCRIKGKEYISNVAFIDETDYNRFVGMLTVKNSIRLDISEQTFTDQSDEEYILRFTVTAPYGTPDRTPYIHIRKHNRIKMMGPDLIKAGMMDQKLHDYLVDCGRNKNGGIIFGGPPGCGKTVILNWFLEEGYEQTASIFVIQESDELFAYRKGIKFGHVIDNPSNGEEPIDMDLLAKKALVKGANVFVIGETKGAEVCDAITLMNSGCRYASTLHANSSTEIPTKLADLAMRGYARDMTQAKRMLPNLTLVYMSDFKIQEISEIVRFDEEKQDLVYRYIYRRPQEQ